MITIKSTIPIETAQEINSLLQCLDRWNPNYYLAAVIGINWGLRCSDIISLTMANVIAGSGKRIQIVDRVRVIEQKTGHERNIYVTDKMKDILYEHIKNRAISEGGVNLSAPLILSRKRTVDKTPKALSRQHISSVINKAAKKVGIRGSIGTHGLRKTFVFQAWKQNISVDVLQKILGHSSVEVTHRYACIPIGYEQETYNKINYGHNSSRKYTRKRNGILP